jgi:hypothetical protein
MYILYILLTFKLCDNYFDEKINGYIEYLKHILHIFKYCFYESDVCYNNEIEISFVSHYVYIYIYSYIKVIIIMLIK